MSLLAWIIIGFITVFITSNIASVMGLGGVMDTVIVSALLLVAFRSASRNTISE